MSFFRLSWWRLLLILPVYLLSLASSRAEKFKSAVIVPIPTTPRLMSSADLNGDGRPDFVYLDSTNSVKVMLATGRKSYGPVRVVPLPSSFWIALAIADVNADGRKDLIISGENGAQSFVGVLLGNGDGTFHSAILSNAINNSSAFPGLTSIAVGDFDEDGKQDLALTNGSAFFNSPSVVVMKGNGLGNFTVGYKFVSTNFGTAPALIVQAADLNRDGHLDLVVLRNQAQDIIVFTGDGKGAFVPTLYDTSGLPPNPNVPPEMNSVVISDIDGDGYPDLVVGTGTSGLQILLNDRTGHFALAPARTGVALPSLNYILAVADFNRDGQLDLVGGSVNGLRFYSGNGDLTFRNADIYAVPSGFLPGATWVDDFDGDGILDFASFTKGGIVIAYGNPDGTFQAAKAYDVGSNVGSVVVSDLNEDGFPDILALTSVGPKSLLSHGHGSFSVVPSNVPAPFSVAVGDFNGDGKPDFVTLDIFSQTIQFFPGNGDGTFLAPINYATQVSGILVGGDFNNDGKPDIAFGSEFSFQSILNAATGVFPTGIPTRNGGPGIVVDDFNKDGNRDVAFVERGNTNVIVFLGNGDGTFQSPTVYPLPNPPFDLFLADLNKDGKSDLVATVGLRSEFAVLYGKGDGTFDDANLIPTPGVSYVTGEAGFLKGDSNEDLVFSDEVLVSVLHGHGDGTFQAPVKYVGGGTPGKPQIADFNGDGTQDVAVSNAGGLITVLFNCGDTNVSLSDSATPQSLYGAPVTFTAILTPASSACGMSTGNVSLTDNGVLLKTGKLSAGQFAFTTSALSVGPHVINGSYSGDSSFDSKSLPAFIHTVVTPAVSISGSPQQPLTKKSSGDFVALVTITNNGNVIIASVQVTTAGTKLGSTPPVSAPVPVTNLAPGASATVELKFPSSAASPTSTTAPLKVSGTYSVPAVPLNGSWTLSFRSVSLRQ